MPNTSAAEMHENPPDLLRSPRQKLVRLEQSRQAFRAAARELILAVIDVAASARETRNWLRSLPTYDLRLTHEPAGERIRRALINDHALLTRGRAVGVAVLPETFESYLRGRSKQALRTNRNRALQEGLTCVRGSDPVESAKLVDSLGPTIAGPMADLMRALQNDSRVQLWFALDADGQCVAGAAITVDRLVARIDLLQVSSALVSRSDGRYLLSAAVVESLIAAGVSMLVSHSLMFAPDGLVYLHARLGFELANVHVIDA